MPSYHDIEVEYIADDGTLVRFGMGDATYGYSLELMRASGWELSFKDYYQHILIAGEYHDRKLRIYCKGVLICGKEPGEETTAVPGVAPTAPIHADPRPVSPAATDPAARQEHTWVACMERLPSKPGPYAGWDGVGYKICYLEYKFGPELGWGETSRCSHWAYLPQPPNPGLKP